MNKKVYHSYYAKCHPIFLQQSTQKSAFPKQIKCRKVNEPVTDPITF